jgi:hypothetical protein
MSEEAGPIYTNFFYKSHSAEAHQLFDQTQAEFIAIPAIFGILSILVAMMIVFLLVRSFNTPTNGSIPPLPGSRL